MKPYYDDGAVRIYHADFRDVPFIAADLVVSDPPFDLWEELAGAVAAVAAPARTLAAFTSYQHRAHVEGTLGPARVELVWVYRDGRWVSHQVPRLCHTSILVYGDIGEAYVGDPITDRTPQRKGAGSVGRDTMAQHIYRPRERKILNTVIEAPRTVGDGVWTKPAAVVAPLVEWLSNPGDLVVDPFCGGGSVLRAAKDLGRRAIGVDISEAACERAALAVAQEVLW